LPRRRDAWRTRLCRGHLDLVNDPVFVEAAPSVLALPACCAHEEEKDEGRRSRRLERRFLLRRKVAPTREESDHGCSRIFRRKDSILTRIESPLARELGPEEREERTRLRNRPALVCRGECDCCNLDEFINRE